MSDKPRSQPAGDKPGAKAAGGGASSGIKVPSSPKSKADADPGESFDFLEASQNLDELGRLAQYRVLKVLGKGGMGTVFMAEDTRLHRIVALKVMLPSIAKQATARERFLREARASAKIEHDHIITIYEVSGEDIEIPYAAMQYLKGMTLDHWLRAGKTLNLPQIMRIGKEIAKGLAAAHAQNLIHRDIKPSNIWLDAVNKGRVKILDFGLTRPTNDQTHLTQEGLILGTPAYMSPEQAQGWSVDERCDLFSLGCLMYRLCAGKLPFTGKDTVSMLLMIINEEPLALQSIKEDLPPALAILIHKLLAKKPDDRPASAKAVVQAIQEVEREWVATGKTVPTAALSASLARKGQATRDATPIEEDPTLDESAITELELQTPQSGVLAAQPPSRTWLLAGLGGALIAVVSVCCYIGVMQAPNQGHVEITVEGDDARAKLDKSRLTFFDQSKQPRDLPAGTHQLPVGGYYVDPDGLAKGLEVKPHRFSIVRGETVQITIRYVPPGPVRPPLVEVTSDEAKQLQRNWAAYLHCDLVATNSLTAKLVLIPPGEIMMGSSDEQLQLLNEITKKFDRKLLPDKFNDRVAAEKPQHRVRITKPFYIGMHEVTFGQFSKFVVEAKPNYVTGPERLGVGGTTVELFKEGGHKPDLNWKNTGFVQSLEHPVCNITWKDAEAYCAWLSNKEKKTYRLPTEAEWEYACRAGSTTLWSFGDDLAAAPGFGHGWNPVFAGKFPKVTLITHPVGKKKVNDFGLHDMHGNVAEMCADYWSPNYLQRPVDDPKGPPPGPRLERIVRGGSFLDLPHLARSAYRRSADSAQGSVAIGFRVVCETPPPE